MPYTQTHYQYRVDISMIQILYIFDYASFNLYKFEFKNNEINEKKKTNEWNRDIEIYVQTQSRTQN